MRRSGIELLRATGLKTKDDLSLGSDARITTMATNRNDQLTQNLTSFQSFSKMLESCEDNEYIPTLVPKGRNAQDIQDLREAVVAAGYQVWPPYSGVNTTAL